MQYTYKLMALLSFKRLWQHINYGSLSKTVYTEILPLRIKENNDMLKRLALITLVFGCVLTVLALSGILSRSVAPAYLFLFLSSVFFLVLRYRKMLAKPFSCYLTGYAQIFALLLFGLLNSTKFSPDPDSNGTIFVVLLLVIPFLMTDIPRRIVPFLLLNTAAYCVLLRIYKNESVIALDTVNAIFVCLISCMCNWLFSAKGFHGMANSLYIEKERDTDALTGLLTKQSARVLTETRLAHGATGMLAIIDLDNFKHVNDAFGHLYGDEVLMKVAACIKENTRRTDIAARFGGDEFVIFYPDMDKNAVRAYADNFFDAINKTFEHEKVHVTCSMGLQDTDATRDYETLFRGADAALYESKRSGKNRYYIGGLL